MFAMFSASSRIGWMCSRAASAFLAALLAGPLGLAAEPLDKEACERLQAEKQSLVTLGVDKDFAKGADWAKANLGEAQLSLLKRYLALDENLKFRCGTAVVTLNVSDDPEDALDDIAAEAMQAAPPMPARREQTLVKPAGAEPAATVAAPAAANGPKIVKPALAAPAAVAPAAKPAAPAAAAAPVKPALPAVKAQPEPAAAKPQGASVPPKPQGESTFAKPPVQQAPASATRPAAPPAAAPAKPAPKPAAGGQG